MSESQPLFADDRRHVLFRRSLTLPLNDSIPPDSGHNLRTLREATEDQHHGTTSTSGPGRIQISKTQFFMQIIRASIGTGVIALPSAVANAGLIFGMVGILFVSIIVMDSAYLMVQSAQTLRKRHSLENVDLDYGTTVKYAFANGPTWGRKLQWTIKPLYFCLAANHLGICSVYILFISENIKFLVDYFDPNFQLPLCMYLIAVTFIVMPLTFIRSLRTLSIISGFGNIFMLLAFGLILFYCCQDLPDITTYPFITDISRIPLFIGVTMFSFGTIEIILPHENALTDKQSLQGKAGLLNLCFGLVLVTNMTIAFYGYAKFGQIVKSSLIHSIPMTPWYYTLVRPMYVLIVFFTFGIQFIIYIDIIWQALKPRVTERLWLRHICAVVSLAVMLGCAATVPHVEQMISLIGSLTGAAVWLVFPVLVHTVTFWEHEQSYLRFQLMVMKNLFVICFGLFGGVVGSYINIKGLFDAFR